MASVCKKKCELEQRRANARLEKYKRADEAKIRELMLAQEQLTMENAKKKEQLEKEVAATSLVQLQDIPFSSPGSFSRKFEIS